MKDTPLPFVVWAMMMVGRPCISVAVSSASSTWRKLCPLISSTAQLNARHLSASGSKRHDVMHGAVELHVVVVQDGGQVGNMELGGRHRAFPYDAALALAVAQQRIYPVGLFLAPAGQRKPDAIGMPCPSRPELISTPGVLSRSGWPCR